MRCGGKLIPRFATAGLAAAVFMTGLLAGCAPERSPVVVASKIFTEGVVLGELLTGALRAGGTAAVHRRQLGGTRILWNALVAGEIDLYAEYTGTISEEILAGAVDPTIDSLAPELAASGVSISAPLGFDNTYAVGMRRDRARELGIASIADLARHPDLQLGFSNEFMDRTDGWPGLRAEYGLPQVARGLDHDLAYRALEAGQIDVTDLYSTDAEIRYYDLRVLTDDRAYFPRYRAVVLYRSALAEQPEVVAAVQRLEGAISASEMVGMNASVKLDGMTEADAAARFLATLGVAATAPSETWLDRLWARTLEHLALVGLSLSAAILVAIPLGIAAARRPALGRIVLGVTGILQTVPALALLVVLIPLLGIGAPPAILALFLYSLLPIVRNTATGLTTIPRPIIESATALGLPGGIRLRRIELPIAAPAILAGIKTAAVINIGTATLGALIGAGGYGQPILTGIRLDDAALILEGAVPAAFLAIGAQSAFDLLERWIVPRGLRL